MKYPYGVKAILGWNQTKRAMAQRASRGWGHGRESEQRGMVRKLGLGLGLGQNPRECPGPSACLGLHEAHPQALLAAIVAAFQQLVDALLPRLPWCLGVGILGRLREAQSVGVLVSWLPWCLGALWIAPPPGGPGSYWHGGREPGAAPLGIANS